MEKSKKHRVVLCEDQRLFRHLLGHYLLHHPDFLIVGEAADGQESLDLIQRAKPEIVLLDLQLPGLHGFEIMRALKRKMPEVKVIVITTADDVETFQEAVRLGAFGFVEKDAPIETICQALNEVAAGGTFFSPKVAPQVRPIAREKPVAAGEAKLTPKEKEVLRLAIVPTERTDIAIKLGVSLATVDRHLAKIKEKAAYGGIADLAEFARSQGVGQE